MIFIVRNYIFGEIELYTRHRQRKAHSMETGLTGLRMLSSPL